MTSFSQLPAAKKDTVYGAARKIFVPSYFVTALHHQTYQNFQQSQQKLGAFLENQRFQTISFKKFGVLKPYLSAH